MEDRKVIEAYASVLRGLRKENSLSQEKLALESGLHPTYISHLETAKKQPTLSVIFRICEHLSCTPSEFLKKLENVLNQ